MLSRGRSELLQKFIGEAGYKLPHPPHSTLDNRNYAIKLLTWAISYSQFFTKLYILLLISYGRET